MVGLGCVSRLPRVEYLLGGPRPFATQPLAIAQRPARSDHGHDPELDRPRRRALDGVPGMESVHHPAHGRVVRLHRVGNRPAGSPPTAERAQVVSSRLARFAPPCLGGQRIPRPGLVVRG